MNVIKKYWAWNENFNLTEFRLGTDVTALIAKGLIRFSENKEYEGISGVPWKVIVNNDKITSVFYREVFFELPNTKSDVWDMQLDNFESVLNGILRQVSSEYQGDKLEVIFRDFFVAVAGIVRV